MQSKRFWTKLAEIPLWLEAHGTYLPWLFRDYMMTPTEADRQQYRALMAEAGQNPESPLHITADDLALERSAQPPEAADLPEDVLEGLGMYRKIVAVMSYRDTLLFHSSALALDGRAYLFTAPSGTGKSTHARLWRQVFGDRVTMINDDKPLLRLQADGTWRVYGTPYAGKEGIQTNTSETVRGIVMLAQGKENKIERVSPHDAYVFLLTQTYHDDQKPQEMLHVMDLVGLLAKLPIFRLQCTISEEAVRVAYQALKGETV